MDYATGKAKESTKCLITSLDEKGTRNLGLASSGELHEHASKTCLELLKVRCIVKEMYDSNQGYEEEA